MEAFLTIFIPVLTVLLALLAEQRGEMSPRMRGMMLATFGLGLVVFAAAITLATSHVLSAVPALIGIALIAIGARRMRMAR